MPREITLPQDTRTFEKTGPNSSLLGRTGKHLGVGMAITVGEGCTMVYDHRDQTAVPILAKGEEFDGLYLLVSEINLPELPL
ncbi:MAG: hypothetical protein AB203_00250 [Parcubacteria bacterium C7867-008]|nr:MAG: hypothetical protein AB203_00250 [Parcubacteria bacterium C7867-008]